MRDVSAKPPTLRSATAAAGITMAPSTGDLVRDRKVPKGDPLEVARVAAVQAVKNTPLLIPYCHPIPIEHVGVSFGVERTRIDVTVTVKAVARTGVEMEALTGAAAAVLTLYDMLKMVDATMSIGEIRLVEKRGGKSDLRPAEGPPLRAAVVVFSDSVAAGRAHDTSGALIVRRLRDLGVETTDPEVLPDGRESVTRAVRRLADDAGLDLIVTTGGTGIGPRDLTPEGLDDVIERRIPGVEEAIRSHGQQRTPLAMFSRATAGIRGRTVIVALPGSERGASDGLDAILPALLHAFPVMRGEGHERGDR